VAGWSEEAHPRGEGGKFAAGGGPEHAGGSRRSARQATKAARRATAGAKTSGDHRKAAELHQGAASAQRAAADAHRKAAGKETDPARKGEHQAAAANAEAMAKSHERAAGEHGDKVRSAPEREGPGAWLAEKIKGAREGVERFGEKAQRFEEGLLKGDPLKAVTAPLTSLGRKLAMPFEGQAAGIGAAANILGIRTGTEGEAEAEVGGKKGE
jgi:hypothetical protein